VVEKAPTALGKAAPAVREVVRLAALVVHPVNRRVVVLAVPSQPEVQAVPVGRALMVQPVRWGTVVLALLMPFMTVVVAVVVATTVAVVGKHQLPALLATVVVAAAAVPRFLPALPILRVYAAVMARLSLAGRQQLQKINQGPQGYATLRVFHQSRRLGLVASPQHLPVRRNILLGFNPRGHQTGWWSVFRHPRLKLLLFRHRPPPKLRCAAPVEKPKRVNLSMQE
jgi:hypothetical protein